MPTPADRTQQPAGASSTSEVTSQDTLPITALMRLLTQQQQQQPATSLQPTLNNGEPGSFPLLQTSKRSKHLDIVDYLRQYETLNDRVIIGNEGEDQVIIRSGSMRPKLDQVTPLQWMGASIRIMRELIGRGQLKAADTELYLSYMEKIGDFASKYTWPSILMYDREYRRWQAQCGCQWGTDNIHLAEILLDVRSRQTIQDNRASTSQHAKHQNKQMNNNSSKSNEICRRYNLSSCTLGDSCKYTHKCLSPGCNAAHPVTQHSAAASKKDSRGTRL
jgi:hypothetical protein